MSEHSKHWMNPETGQAECECCCSWALDAERDRKRIAKLEQEVARLRNSCDGLMVAANNAISERDAERRRAETNKRDAAIWQEVAMDRKRDLARALAQLEEEKKA